MPRDHHSLQLWLSHMDTRIQYTGQTLASLCGAYVSEKLRAARPDIPTALKKEVFQRQGGACTCGAPL